MTDKLRVLFVDDEIHILRGIRRSMLVMEEKWEMTFCSSGAEALAAMDVEVPFDVVVSDMRMPQMDGAEFLQAVRARHPETIRVILSGYADLQSILRTVGPAHAYLAKPCSADVLQAAVNRALDLRHLLESPQLRAILTGLTNLPSLPSLFLDLDEELHSPGCSAKTVASIIDKDVSMMAELLRLTNSSYFSVAGPISSTFQAVRMIGLETVQSLVLQIGIFRQFRGKESLVPVLYDITEYSIRIAGLAEKIARTMDVNPPLLLDVHCAATLSLIGVVVLLDAFPDTYADVFRGDENGVPLSKREETAFGASHAVVGAYLLRLWGFPTALVEAVAYAGNPSGCLRYDNPVLTALHAAVALGPEPSFGTLGNCAKEGLDMRYLIEARHDGLVAQWRDLAAEMHEG